MEKLQRINGLLRAAVILVTGYFFRDGEGYESVLGVQGIAFTLILGFLQNIGGKGRRENSP